MRVSRLSYVFCAFAAAGCSSHDVTSPVSTSSNPSLASNPCSVSGTLQLAIAQAAQVDCSNGGTTLTLAGNGASYLVVAQFAVDRVADVFVPYHVSTGALASTSLATSNLLASRTRPSLQTLRSAAASVGLRPSRPRAAQHALEGTLRARAARALSSGAWHPSAVPSSAALVARGTAAATAVPAVGSVRSFQVLANETTEADTTVAARLVYSGNSVLFYLDTLTPANGFTPSQLQAYGQLFDQTLYPIDTAAFGGPSDIDQNGHVIVLMSPVVNALTPTSTCNTEGYVAGFFNQEDLGGGASDPYSNNGEIFYSIAPDPSGTVSCAHPVSDISDAVPGTFLHELQHLISFSQHVVIHGGQPEYGWLDEGLSIVAEELGSLYYENKCPPPACRTDPSQIFPDSSQGFAADFLYDSYQYALLPDTASVTLHDDSEDGFSWRGGDWLLMRWLGDQYGTGLFKKMDQNTVTGVANIESASGQSFPKLFSNFGLSLYTDSLPGLPRTTAPAADRFVTRNVRALWDRLYITSASSAVPYPNPLTLVPITSDTTTNVMYPGTGSYWRLDTGNAATVTIQFSAPGGSALSASLKPQLAVFRLPAGQ